MGYYSYHFGAGELSGGYQYKYTICVGNLLPTVYLSTKLDDDDDVINYRARST